MIIKVIATPNSRKEIIEKTGENIWRIHIKEPAEHHRANARILEIIAQQYKVSNTKVFLMTGHRSRFKMIRITN